MRGERVFVAVLILFSAAALWESHGIAGFSRWSSPGVFPMLASTTMLICALLIFRHSGKPVDVSARQADDSCSSPARTAAAINAEQTDFHKVLPMRVLVISTLLVLYVFIMPTLGFLLSSGVFLLSSIGYLWKKPLWLTLLISLGSLAIIHLLFRQVFQVILPEGTLIRLLV